MLASFAQVTRISLEVEGGEVQQLHGWQAHHELISQALEIIPFWGGDSADQKNNLIELRPP